MDAQKYMLRCLELAQKASDEDEVPIGAAVVDPESGEIVSEAYNLSEHKLDATAHAETLAIRRACEKLGVQGSWDFAYEVMRRAHLAVTPGRDFGTFDPQRFVRFSTANSMAQLQESVARLRGLLG